MPKSSFMVAGVGSYQLTFFKAGGVLLRDLKLPLSREKLQELTGDPRVFFFSNGKKDENLGVRSPPENNEGLSMASIIYIFIYIYIMSFRSNNLLYIGSMAVWYIYTIYLHWSHEESTIRVGKYSIHGISMDSVLLVADSRAGKQ